LLKPIFQFCSVIFLALASCHLGAVETVALQLKWKHQFQFAGYYAAREKGFYSDVGLEVVIREAQPGVDPISQVLEGNANFGVGTSELLLRHSQGDPVRVLAVVFQHSPLALAVASHSSGTALDSIIDQPVMIEPNSAELFTFLEKQGIKGSQLDLEHHSFNIQDLIAGKVKAMSVYVTDEPFVLTQAGFPYQIYRPVDGGVDFYGDNLFTTAAEIADNDERTRAFLEASIKGWKYAMDNPEEIIQLIYHRYSQRHSIEHLRFEAQQMRKLLTPSIIEPGYMHIGRWHHIAETYRQIGQLPQHYEMGDLLYRPTEPVDLSKYKFWIIALVIFTLTILAISAYSIRLNRQLKASQIWLRTIVDNAPTALIIIEQDGTISGWNHHAQETFGWSADDAIGRNAFQLLVPAKDQNAIKKVMQDVYESGAPYQGKSWIVTRTGVKILCQWNNVLVERNDKTEKSLLSMAIDVTRQKIMEDKLKLKAHTDPLTGATNRNLFYLKFNQSIIQAKRQKHILATLFVDLDNFKRINDNYGHQAGDIVLKTIADRLRNNRREIDLVARIGGDEFVVLLYDCQSRDTATQVAEKLLKVIIKPIEINESRMVAVSASIGISLYPEHGDKPDELMRAADLAMYRVKQVSKNNIFIADSHESQLARRNS